MTFRYALAAFTVAAIVAPVAQARAAHHRFDANRTKPPTAPPSKPSTPAIGAASAQPSPRANDDVLDGAVRGRMLLSRSYRAGWSDYTSLAEPLRRLRHGAGGLRPRHGFTFPPRTPQRHARAQPSGGPRPHALPGTPPAISRRQRFARASRSSASTNASAQGDFEGARNIAYAQVGGPRSGVKRNGSSASSPIAMHDYAEAVRQFEASAQWPHHGGWAALACTIGPRVASCRRRNQWRRATS
jgi:hypothetical protein